MTSHFQHCTSALTKLTGLEISKFSYMYEPSTDFFSSDPLSLEAPSDQTCCVEQSEKGMLDGRIHFGRSGVNMLWVIEADE